LFERCKEEMSLGEEDLEELENIREKAWSKIQKKHGL